MKVKVRYSVEYEDEVDVGDAPSVLSNDVYNACYADACSGPRKGWRLGTYEILELVRLPDASDPLTTRHVL